MKYKFAFFLIVIQIYNFYGQKKEIIKSSFVVEGNCYMCKNRIEKTVFKIKGVKHVDWNVPSNKISIIYNDKKASIENIHKEIAASGHDTRLQFAPDSIYKKLPDCCLYRGEDKKKLLSH